MTWFLNSNEIRSFFAVELTTITALFRVTIAGKNKAFKSRAYPPTLLIFYDMIIFGGVLSSHPIIGMLIAKLKRSGQFYDVKK